jgi:hypothetical protein
MGFFGSAMNERYPLCGLANRISLLGGTKAEARKRRTPPV